jgi:chromosome segregation ATPase
MSAAMTTAGMAQRVAAAAAVLTAGAAGVYAWIALGEVSALEAEAEGLKTRAFVARGKLRRAETDIAEADAAIKALSQQAVLDDKQLTETAHALGEARAEVARLEALAAAKEADLARARAEIDSASATRSAAAAEIGRLRDEAALAERALATLRTQVDTARAAVNPLNHPRVRELMGRK